MRGRICSYDIEASQIPFTVPLLFYLLVYQSAIMLSATTRPFIRMPSLPRLTKLKPIPLAFFRRNLSVHSIHSSFPASLFCYSPRQKSSLFDIKDLEKRCYDPFENAVKVSADELVYPGTTEGSSRTYLPDEI